MRVRMVYTSHSVAVHTLQDTAHSACIYAMYCMACCACVCGAIEGSSSGLSSLSCVVQASGAGPHNITLCSVGERTSHCAAWGSGRRAVQRGGADVALCSVGERTSRCAAWGSGRRAEQCGGALNQPASPLTDM